MTAQTVDPERAMHQFLARVPATRRILIGYSGGMDSHVLLQAAKISQVQRPDLELLALHVDHGLQRGSVEWASHCRKICRDLGVGIQVLEARIHVDPAVGLEASARMARYGLFSSAMRDGDFLVLAQHADDQAETFLLQALRGSGPDGLASIPRKRAFGAGWLCRPLLGLSRNELESWAHRHELKWIEDPSNSDTRFDRNFLRQEVIPLLQSRWPSLSQTLSRSAARCGAASHLLISLASEDLELVRSQDSPVGELRSGPSEQLSISLLSALGQERMFNVLRLWVRQTGYDLPRLQDLKQVESTLLNANTSSGGVVNVREYEFRRYGNQLHLLPPQVRAAPFRYKWRAPFADLSIPEAGVLLSRSQCLEQGLRIPATADVRIQSRVGGEMIRIGRPAFNKPVKKLLQEARVPPWQRDKIPLIYVDGSLAAVWRIAVAEEFHTEPVRGVS